jgi:hypothetical protein
MSTSTLTAPLPDSLASGISITKVRLPSAISSSV